MEKLKLENLDILKDNIIQLKKLFPQVFVEEKIDFQMLKELLGENIDIAKERYSLTWNGKSRARQIAQEVSTGTLRPAKEESKNWDNTENIYIEGDNLEVLKLLQKSYYRKIDTIYTDPPYNTGNDIIYKNDYNIDLDYYKKITGQKSSDNLILTTNLETSGSYHSDWLSMMSSRILLARNLLTDDGIICLAIDYNELHSLAFLCDEIFGEHNRIGMITVVSKPEGRNQEKFFATSTEYALFYAKNKNNCKFNSVILDDEIKKTFDREDIKGKYRLNNYIRLGGGDANLRKNKPHFYYPIYISKDLSKISLEDMPNSFVKYPNTTNQERTWKTKKETFQERLELGEIIAEFDSKGELQIYEKYRIDNGQLIKTHWTDKKYNFISNGTNILENLMGGKFFDFPKSLYYVKDIINLISKKNGYVLDFFSGSATTVHAVMQLNAEDGGSRKHVTVQIPFLTEESSEAYKAGYKNICEIGKERIRRAGDKIKGENLLLTANLDTGFRVFKIDSSNMKDVYYSPSEISQDFLSALESNIKEDRTDLDLLFGCLLEWGLPLSLPYKSIEIDGCVVHNYNDGDLIACFEENISENVMKEIAKLTPLRAVFRDSSFENSAEKINTSEIFKLLSPDTKIKVI